MKRARTTLSYLAVAILGTPEDRAAYRAAVDRAHRQGPFHTDSPVKYNAFDRDLQMWVAACLFVGLEDTYQLLRGELSAEQAEEFYRSGFTPGTTPSGHRGSVAAHPCGVRRLPERGLREGCRWTTPSGATPPT